MAPRIAEASARPTRIYRLIHGVSLGFTDEATLISSAEYRHYTSHVDPPTPVASPASPQICSDVPAPPVPAEMPPAQASASDEASQTLQGSQDDSKSIGASPLAAVWVPPLSPSLAFTFIRTCVFRSTPYSESYY
mmetsp:Transcript_738/g.761  ORF Transcript_738/g.761 Transcript_738/m.761 type:complete len:135 (-) Transcript_738:22-426(-)